jgi:hypothetical protein
MRLESQRASRLTDGFGAMESGGNHRLVAAMDAVEIPHGEYCAAKCAAGIAVAHDKKIIRCHRVSMVKKIFVGVGAAGMGLSQAAPATEGPPGSGSPARD